MKRDNIIYGISSISFLVLLAVLNWTSPEGASPFLILFIFGLFYVVCFGAYLIIYKIFNLVLRQVYYGSSTSHRVGSRRPKAHIYIAILSLAPVLLVALSSIGRVSWHETLLILMMIGLLCFYLYKKT